MRLITFFLLVGVVLQQAHAFQRRKFHNWLPYYEYLWKAKTPMCQTQLNNYYANSRTGHHPVPCAAVVDCLLTNVTESVKSNIASADILLGIAPQIMGFVGPTGGEMAILSTYDPVLTSLLSFGFPSRSITGLFSSVDVPELLRKPVARTARAYHLWLEQQPPRVRQLMLALVYLAAGSAVANNIYTSIYLDLRTVSGWRCGADYMPLAWSTSGFLVVLVEMLAIRTRQVPGCPQRRWLGWSYRRSEPHSLLPCILPEAQDGFLTEILFGVSNFMGIVQLVFGTIVLSALLFISFLDALPILLRYGASATMCNLLLRLELAELRCRFEVTLGAGAREKTRHFQLVEQKTGWGLELIRTLV